MIFDLNKQSWRVERHNAEQSDGLPKGHLNRLFLDSRGGVWIGADNGLVRVDPLIQQFRPQMVYASPDTCVSYVLDAAEENVRHIAPRGLGSLDKMEQTEWTTIDLFAGTRQLPGICARKMLADKKGNIWVLDFHRLLCLDKQKNQLRSVRPSDWLEEHGENVQFNDMCLDSRKSFG